ncbi:hypothetical protein CCR75_001099 [Bremia lactucae]|uniref:Glycoside hydrolase n=1 Tax=Bremia lactucae TaxID=4779 RepID=A0A976IH16_BRELC|nr:hypothetical protein CCR75_001099 [Bremia lactucae]
MAKIFRSPLAMITLASCFFQHAFASEKLCSIAPTTYTMAKTKYPNLVNALTTLEKYPIVAWYTDRQSEVDRKGMLSRITSECSDNSRMTIAVYGLPNKDCNTKLSSSGTVHSTSDYESFLSTLTTAVGDRKVLYIVEPDAVGLLANNGCGQSAGYLKNLKIAIAALSANPNAELYVDVGYWLLGDSTKASEVATIVKELNFSGVLKGIAINTSNYRSTDECMSYCDTFQAAMGMTTLSCIVDTSRNYHGSPTTDWCNIKSAGIGKPPTSKTNISNVDYFLWVKPPGESDGICVTSTQSLTGVTAGTFYAEGFQSLWDQGYFIDEKTKATIGGSTSDHVTSNDASVQFGAGSDVKDTSANDSVIQTIGTVAPADTDSSDDSAVTTPATVATPIVTTLPPTTISPNATDFGLLQQTSACKPKRRMREL